MESNPNSKYNETPALTKVVEESYFASSTTDKKMLYSNNGLDVQEFASFDTAAARRIPDFPASPLKLPASVIENKQIAVDLTRLAHTDYSTPPVSPTQKPKSRNIFKFWKWGNRAKATEPDIDKSGNGYKATRQNTTSSSTNTILHATSIQEHRKNSKIYPAAIQFAPQTPTSSDGSKSSSPTKKHTVFPQPTADAPPAKTKKKKKAKTRGDKEPSAWGGLLLWIVFILTTLGVSLGIIYGGSYKPQSLLSGTVPTVASSGPYQLLPGAASVQYVPISSGTRTAKANEFCSDLAWKHMQAISMRRRPHNSFAIADTQAYIAAYLTQMQELAVKYNKRFEVYGDDTVTYTDVDTMGPDDNARGLFVESSNLVARLYGTSNVQVGPALLLYTNYDSAPASYGASVNGVSVGVLMEVMRLLIQGPYMPNSVIFLFSNLEEAGGLGVRGFTKHPWFADVRTFVSLNSVGAAGEVTVTKSNSYQLDKIYTQTVPYPNVNTFSSDVYSWYWSSFASSYNVLAKEARLPGLELGFIVHRGIYRSSIDDVYHVPLFSVQTMGENTLALARTLVGQTDSTDFIQTTGKVVGQSYQQPVTFSITGNTAVTMSLATLLIIQSCLLVVFLVVLAVGVVLRDKACFVDMLKAFFTLACGILVTFGIATLLNLVIYKSNPLGNYTLGYVPYLYLFFFFLFGLTLFSAAIWKLLSKSLGNRDARAQALLYGQLLVWWVLLLLSLIFAAIGYGLFYYVFWFAMCQCASVIVFELLSTTDKTQTKWRRRKSRGVWVWILCFLIQAVFPFIIQWDLASLIVRGFVPASVDGVNDLSLMTLLSLIAVVSAIVWVPFAIRAKYPKLWSIALGIAALALYIVSCVTTPYSQKSGYTPSKLVFVQDYDAGSGISQMTFYGMQQVKRQIGGSWLLQQLALNCKENQRPFGSQLTFAEACSLANYNQINIPTGLVLTAFTSATVLPSGAFGLSLEKESFKRNPSTQVRRSVYKVYVLQSSMCRVKVTGKYNNIRLRIVGMQYNVLDQYESSSRSELAELWIVKKSFGVQLWTFEIEAVIQASNPVPLTVTCMYDDVERQMPYFQQVQNSLPRTTTLASFGFGLLRVHQSVYV